jgi:hypothetical protein
MLKLRFSPPAKGDYPKGEEIFQRAYLTKKAASKRQPFN